MGCCTSTIRSAHSSPYGAGSRSPATHPGTTTASASANAPLSPDSSRANITSNLSSPSIARTTHSFISQHTRQPSQSRSHVDTPSRHSNTTATPTTTSAGPPLKPPPAPHKVHLPSSLPLNTVGAGQRSPWTRARLLREREAFWDTRVTGRAEVWQVVRLVCELVRQGELGEARGVLEAGGCSCPTGEVWRGVWDQWGGLYEVPAWIVGEPEGLLDVGEEEGRRSVSPVDEGRDAEGKEEFVDIGEDMEADMREKKGKGKAAEVGEMVRVRARLSDRGTDVLVKIGTDEKVAALVRRVQEVAGISGRKRIKIGYLGRILHENDSLASQGWREGQVVNAFVFQ